MKMITKVFLSDLHIGRRKNDQIVTSIMYMLNEKIDAKETDYIIISGDVYDRLLSLDSTPAVSSVNWAFDIADFCRMYDIKLRILKGTHSHDRDQIDVIDKIISRAYPDLDFKYLKTITLLEESDHTCLYIPDEIRATAEAIYKASLETINQHSLAKVNNIVMHGGFKHSSGGFINDDTHDELKILSLCSGFVVSGHIHKHQVYGRIITPGPIERLSHGHEDPVGIIITREFPLDTDKNLYEFIENDRAKIFKTINVLSTTYTDLLNEVVPHLMGIPKYSEIRLKFKDENPLLMRGDFNDISDFHNFEFITESSILQLLDYVNEEIVSNDESIMILNENTTPTLIGELLSRYDINNTDRERILSKLTKD